MTPAETALARRAVAANGWRWLPGMLTHSTRAAGFPGCRAGTPIRVEDDGLGDYLIEGYFGEIAPEPNHRHPEFGRLMDLHAKSMERAVQNALPDLADPATIGCLLALVREKWNNPTIHAVPESATIWHINRLDAGEQQWLRLDGSWGYGRKVRADPIAAPTETEALVLALETEP